MIVSFILLGIYTPSSIFLIILICHHTKYIIKTESTALYIKYDYIAKVYGNPLHKGWKKNCMKIFCTKLPKKRKLKGNIIYFNTVKERNNTSFSLSNNSSQNILANFDNFVNNEELLMIILKTGTKKYSVKEVSINILKYFNGLSNLKNATPNTLRNIEGIGYVKAIELTAIIELAKRINEHTTIKDIITCTDPISIINYFNYLFKDKKQEEFYVLYLDNKKKYIDKKRLFIGSINNSVAHPREIFKNAYLLSASYIICIHNHPSGDATPSREDIIITKNLYEISNIHAIYLIDHIIIGNNNYYSFFQYIY